MKFYAIKLGEGLYFNRERLPTVPQLFISKMWVEKRLNREIAYHTRFSSKKPLPKIIEVNVE